MSGFVSHNSIEVMCAGWISITNLSVPRFLIVQPNSSANRFLSIDRRGLTATKPQDSAGFAFVVQSEQVADADIQDPVARGLCISNKCKPVVRCVGPVIQSDDGNALLVSTDLVPKSGLIAEVIAD